jgi:hypothetical protein
MQDNIPPDTLNEIGVLKRREIEARILAPVINALAAEFGRERVIEIAKRVIVEIARQQGKALDVAVVVGIVVAPFVEAANEIVGGVAEYEARTAVDQD